MVKRKKQIFGMSIPKPNIMRASNDTHKKIFFILLQSSLITAIFLITYLYFVPVKFENLGGGHSWLTGSTIKFTNMWLEEGPVNLHFTSYESYPSIEFNSTADRTPYVSYPPGTVGFTYCIAGIFHKKHIDVGFIKRLQFCLFLLECILWGIFVFLLLDLLKLHNNLTKLITGVLTSSVYMLYPANAWYLLNIFYADQLVLFYATIFFLIELLRYTIKNKTGEVVINILSVLIIFCGVSTDYYFWIIVFVAWILNLWHNIYIKDQGEMNGKRIFVETLIYIIPTCLAVMLFALQLLSIDDGFDLLHQRFLQRTGQSAAKSELSDTGFIARIKIIISTICLFYKNGMNGLIVFVSYIFGFVFLSLKLLKNKGPQTVLTSPVALLILLITLTPPLQILLLNQHSAVHEFGLIKLAHPLSLLLPILTYLIFSHFNCQQLNDTFLFDKRHVSIYSCIFLPIWIIAILAIGIPQKTKAFYLAKDKKENYTIEETLKMITDYNDVIFSYTYEIPINPPEKLCISEKQVYLIHNFESIDSLFPNLNSAASKLLLIENYPNNIKSETIITQELYSLQNGRIRFEDEYMKLVYFPEYDHE